MDLLKRGCVAQMGGVRSKGRNEIMVRKLRELGLVLVATFAISAMVASTASANYTITSPGAGTTVTGEQVGLHEFGTSGQVYKCTTVTFEGEVTAAEVEEVELTPSYSGCTYAAGAKVIDLTMNGCKYLLTGATTADGKHGVTHIKCPAGSKIELHFTNFNGSETCTVTIAEQAATQGYTTTNNGHHIDLHTTARVKLTPHGKGGCPLLVSGLYTGTTTVRGFSAKPHVLGTVPTGNQVNLDVHS